MAPKAKEKEKKEEKVTVESLTAKVNELKQTQAQLEQQVANSMALIIKLKNSVLNMAIEKYGG